jgi:hypothetical protein
MIKIYVETPTYAGPQFPTSAWLYGAILRLPLKLYVSYLAA